MRRRAGNRLTEADLLALRARIAGKETSPAPKKSKYRNVKVMHAGEKFDSKRELARWMELKDMERAGQISDLRRQVPFVLAPKVDLGEGRKKTAMKYIADAVYTDNTGKQVVEDVKGRITKEYRTKKHLMATVHGIVIMEVK